MPVDVYTLAQAKAWIKEHGYAVRGLGEAGAAYYRFRQFDPDHRHDYRTIPFGKSGILAVIEVPKRR
jgi:hypothetical protein